MASNIEWTNETWNPITGCSPVSEGCRNCYAAREAVRLAGHPNPKVSGPYEGSAEMRGAGDRRRGVFTGRVRTLPERLEQPLRWRKPRRVFVNSMSDLFHPDVPFEFIDRVWAVMALADRHAFQVLTKRPDRMAEYLNDPEAPYRIARAIDGIAVDGDRDPEERWAVIPGYPDYEASSHGRVRSAQGILATTMNPVHDREQVTLWNRGEQRTWFVHALVLMAHRGLPEDGQEARHRNGDRTDNDLANLQWASRSENQRDKSRHGSFGGDKTLTLEQASEIREARAVGGRTQQDVADEYGVSRSLVSLIENGKAWALPIEWPLPNVWLGTSVEDQAAADERIPHLLRTPAAVRFLSCEPLLGRVDLWRALPSDLPFDGITVDWVIVGGESGPQSRPCDVEWIRGIVRDCQATGVPTFVKQLGANVHDRNDAGFGGDSDDSWDENHVRVEWLPMSDQYQGAPVRVHLHDRKGGDPEEWPEDLRIREFPEAREAVT